MSEVTEKIHYRRSDVCGIRQHPRKKTAPGLSFKRYFTKAGVSPYDEIEWELRLAQITDSKGNVIFEQKDVEVPKDWSMTATNIVASKYLHGQIGTPERETGVRQLIQRVAETIRDWGMTRRLLPLAPKTPPSSTTSSPTSSSTRWRPSIRPSGSTSAAIASSPTPTPPTGTGIAEPRTRRILRHRLQARRSAPPASSTPCNDSLDSILTLAKTEGMLFKWGSGTGTNLSPLASPWRRSPAAAPPPARSAS